MHKRTSKEYLNKTNDDHTDKKAHPNKILNVKRIIAMERERHSGQQRVLKIREF